MGELEIFSTRLKALREKMEMTQKDFSEFIEVKQQTLSGYETGKMKPPLDVAKKIAEKCEVSLDWLCGLTEKKTNTTEIKTYSDLFLLLLQLDNPWLGVSIKIEERQRFDECQGENCEGCNFREKCEQYEEMPVIVINNKKVHDFFEEWIKIRDMIGEGYIDFEIFELWKEKMIRKYNKELSENYIYTP